MNETLQDAHSASAKMNEVADKMLFAGYAIVGCLASYATFKILTKFWIKPMFRTYRFLSSQSFSMKQKVEEKYGNGLAVIAGGKSGMSTTWAAYLGQIGVKTVLLIGGDQEKMDNQKKILTEGNGNLSILTYLYDFAKRHNEEEKKAITDYCTQLMEQNGNHCPILINNIAVSHEIYKQLAPLMIGNLTNIKINNHNFITRLLMVDLRNKGLRKQRGLVINVGTTQEHLTQSMEGFQFADENAKDEWELYNSTVSYWTNITTLKERHEAVEVDFKKDCPETVGKFASNLKYLGIDVAPGTHVDQVMRSAIGEYQNSNPQGVFKYRCMMYLMKPFFWALLPFQLVGMVKMD